MHKNQSDFKNMERLPQDFRAFLILHFQIVELEEKLSNGQQELQI